MIMYYYLIALRPTPQGLQSACPAPGRTGAPSSGHILRSRLHPGVRREERLVSLPSTTVINPCHTADGGAGEAGSETCASERDESDAAPRPDDNGGQPQPGTVTPDKEQASLLNASPARSAASTPCAVCAPTHLARAAEASASCERRGEGKRRVLCGAIRAGARRRGGCPLPLQESSGDVPSLVSRGSGQDPAPHHRG